MAKAPDDGFLTYFTEKLWDMIPAFYRDEDGDVNNPNTGVLRSLVELVAEQAVHQRRSTDAVWNDTQIDLCRNWAVPYVADLLGTRLVSALDLRARRIDVAKTIYYRRRAGTVRVLEELIADIGGYEGVVVEEFRRLARFHHMLDPQPGEREGRFTRTPPGGYADLRNQRGSELAGSPFDEYFHLLDVRRGRSRHQVYSVPKVAVHIYRLQAYPIVVSVPRQGPDALQFTFDPSGRDVQLFMRRNRTESYDWDQWRSALEWELPAPMRCRLLNHAEFRITEELLIDLQGSATVNVVQAAELRTLVGNLYVSEFLFRDAVAALPSGAVLAGTAIFSPLLRGALTQDCAKSALLPSYVPPGSTGAKSLRIEQPAGTELTSERIIGGDLSGWNNTLAGKRAVVDPERGRLLFIGAAPATVRTSWFYGFSAGIGAGGYDRAGHLLPATMPLLTGGGAIAAAQIGPGTLGVPAVTSITDSLNYGPVVNLTNLINTRIQAENPERPYVRLAGEWIIDSGPNVESRLVLEGLWIGANGPAAIRIRGDWEEIVIRHCTFDPGGADAWGAAIAPVQFIVENGVEHLIIDRSIMCRVTAIDGATVETVTITDSILHSDNLLSNAIRFPTATVELMRSTVFGRVRCNRMQASEALIAGAAFVTNSQDGCFRFSAAETGSLVPKPYESYFFANFAGFFTSTRFGDPGYAQLSQNAPEPLRSGAENQSEVGAFSSLLAPIRLQSLQAKVNEYLPFGLIPVYVPET